jgi:hypothetical protein
MILFQEDEQTVSFDPICVDGPVPWYENLYALYILVVVIVLLVRVVQIVWKLRKMRKLEKAGEDRTDNWRQIWGLAKLQAHGLEKLAVLTFFFSCFEFAMQVHHAFGSIVAGRTPFPKWPFIFLAQQTPAYGAVALICASLYACGFFFESHLERRKLAIIAGSTPQSPTN